MPKEYGVHYTFNVMDLIPFVGSNEEEEDVLDLRTNIFQEGGDDDRSPSSTHRRSGPTTRAMARRIQEDWYTTIDGRETFLYMFKMS